MSDSERREYARRVISNPTRHYLDEPHLDVLPEWIEMTIADRIIKGMMEESCTFGGLMK